VFDFWPQALAQVARKNRSALGFLVGRWGTPVPRKVPLYMVGRELLTGLLTVSGFWGLELRKQWCAAEAGVGSLHV
jgi:hypothetical protein